MNFIKRLFQPEIDDLVGKFTKLEKKIAAVAQRHATKIGLLQDEHDAYEAAKQEILSEIADTKAEIARAKRIGAKILDLIC